MSSEVLGVSLTIAATVISVYNTVLFYRQSRLVEKQTLLERSQVYPYLRIRDMNVKQNMFKLTLENKGESPAFARARARLEKKVSCIRWVVEYATQAIL
jgi:hypothetical protein